MRYRGEKLTDLIVVNTGIVANNQWVKVLTEEDEAVWWTWNAISANTSRVSSRDGGTMAIIG